MTRAEVMREPGRPILGTKGTSSSPDDRREPKRTPGPIGKGDCFADVEGQNETSRLQGVERRGGAVKVANPGIYHGIRQIRFIVNDVLQTGLFHVIEATPGTWLSAATKKHGWGARYGAEAGYGAYVKGIVRREDGSYIWGKAADQISPGEHFAISIYDGEKKAKQKPGEATLPPGFEDQLEPGGSADEIASVVGLGADVVLDVLVEFFPVLTPLSIAKQLWGSVTAVTRASNSNESMAAIRAECYATTAFVWREHEGQPHPLSTVFSSRLLPGLLPDVEKAWKDAWVEASRELNKNFKEMATRFYMEVSRKGGDVDINQLHVRPLRGFLKRRAVRNYGTAPQYCDKLLEEAASYWANKISAIEKRIWEYHRQTKYPN